MTERQKISGIVRVVLNDTDGHPVVPQEMKPNTNYTLHVSISKEPLPNTSQNKEYDVQPFTDVLTVLLSIAGLFSPNGLVQRFEVKDSEGKIEIPLTLNKEPSKARLGVEVRREGQVITQRDILKKQPKK